MPAPNDLGGLLTTHHPINPALALTMCAAPGLLVGAGLWLGPVGSLALGGFAFVLLTGLLVGLFAESLFVRQQVYEYGLRLSSTVPLTPRFVIPYASIDADSVRAAPYHRPKAADVTDTFDPRYRQAPTVPVVTFVGLAPGLARRLAKDWASSRSDLDEALALPPAYRSRSHEYTQWFVSFRRHEAVAETLRTRVRRHGSGPR